MRTPRIWMLSLALCAVIAASASPVRADYLGSQLLRIVLDPASAPVVADGYQIGDEVSWILESSARDTGSNEGQLSYMTLYVPPGVEVVGASFVAPGGGAGWTAMPRTQTSRCDGCGQRGCVGYASGVSGILLGDGILRESQSDTGIFYSTDSRTQLVPEILPTLVPTGTVRSGLRPGEGHWSISGLPGGAGSRAYDPCATSRV